MRYSGLAAALNMEGAFNDVALKLMRGASEPEVLKRLDALTESYGGIGAYGRSDQVSHQYISDEIRQLRGMGTTIPIIFLGVAAFLLNVVISRLINTQREQIASLQAFGYTRLQIGIHYIKMVCMIPIVGTIAGTLFGAWLGGNLAEMYSRFYKFPALSFQLRPAVVLGAFVVSGLAAVIGTLAAVRRAVSLAPAEAMRPEGPAVYRPTVFGAMGPANFLATNSANDTAKHGTSTH
jgi:putative ABC transport system permease protein